MTRPYAEHWAGLFNETHLVAAKPVRLFPGVWYVAVLSRYCEKWVNLFTVVACLRFYQTA